MTQTVIVLGAGMVGTCTAWHLRQRGHEVVLIDAKPPGQETSFGNAGLIQREAAEPYPFPLDAAKLWAVATGQGFDIAWRARALLRIAPRLLSYAWHSAPKRHARLAPHYGRLIQECLSEHEVLIESSQAHDLVGRGGYRKIYRTQAALDRAGADARRIAERWGVDSRIEDADALARAEPALRQRLAGALWHASTWSVRDPGALVQRYARDFQRLGGTFLQARATALQPLGASGANWQVQTSLGPLQASQVVVALGPWSCDLIGPLSYRPPLFVKRGYHQHYDGPHGLRLPIFDAEKGYLLVPMRAGLRLTTGAELALRDDPPQPSQLPAAERCARALVELGAPLPQPPWMGSRPCMVDMLPVMGPAPRHRGLWFNFGHGHQGFTLGPVAGRLLAELISGEPPFLDPAPYAAQRFGP
jgi:D-amino-acid dehydrogenase